MNNFSFHFAVVLSGSNNFLFDLVYLCHLICPSVSQDMEEIIS